MEAKLSFLQKDKGLEVGREVGEGEALSPTGTPGCLSGQQRLSTSKKWYVQSLWRRISIHAPLLRQEGVFLKDWNSPVLSARDRVSQFWKSIKLRSEKMTKNKENQKTPLINTAKMRAALTVSSRKQLWPGISLLCKRQFNGQIFVRH